MLTPEMTFEQVLWESQGKHTWEWGVWSGRDLGTCIWQRMPSGYEHKPLLCGHMGGGGQGFVQLERTDSVRECLELKWQTRAVENSQISHLLNSSGNRVLFFPLPSFNQIYILWETIHWKSTEKRAVPVNSCQLCRNIIISLLYQKSYISKY